MEGRSLPHLSSPSEDAYGSYKYPKSHIAYYVTHNEFYITGTYIAITGICYEHMDIILLPKVI